MRARRFATVIAALLVVFSAWWIADRVHQRRDEAARHEAQAKAQSVKAEVDAKFTVGTPQAEVVRALQGYGARFSYAALVDHGPGSVPGAQEYWMVVAEQPSESWVCDRTASVVVSADFKDQKFAGTHIWVWPHGCL